MSGWVQVRETLEPLLAKNRPSWMAELSLHTFTLGDTPPHVSAVKARSAQTISTSTTSSFELVV